MQIIHDGKTSKNSIFSCGSKAQMSILFDKIEYNQNITTDQVAIIDRFFDDL